MRADITVADGAEDGVRQCMQADVSIRMALNAWSWAMRTPLSQT